MKKFKEFFAFVAAFFSINSADLIEDNKFSLTEDQQKQLEEALGGKVDLPKLTDAINAELAEFAKKEAEDGDAELQDLRKKAFDMLKAHGLSREESEQLIDNPADATTATEKEMLAGLTAAMKEQDKKIAKLLTQAEDDSPLEIIRSTASNIMHSKTHLFGSGKAYDSFDGRVWNQMAAGRGGTMPTFAAESTEVETLKGDMELYHREVNADLQSLFRDYLKLPSFWNIRTNVDDRVADGNVVTAEITQARKKGWLPKNKALIQPEEAQIYPVQVDIEYAGYLLQDLLTSWLHQYNKEGSQAYKWSFVRFLVAEFDKRARQEDRIVSVKGVHVPTPDTSNIPGLAINRSDGILIKLWRAYNYKKQFRVANVGKPTPHNIVDYVKDVIEKNIPKEEINSPNLVFYLSPEWLRRHVERKRVLFGHDNNYTGQELMQIENFPNIEFCPLVDLSGSDFMFITYKDNIELLENIPGERAFYHFESFKRDMFVFADYKWGVRIKHIGTRVKAGDPDAFKVQTVWTNGMPMFPADFFVRLYDTGQEEIEIPYSNITVTDDYAEDIQEVKNLYEGQIVRIAGNPSNDKGKAVKNGAKIVLKDGTAFNLNTDGTLILRADADGKLHEVKRTQNNGLPGTEVNFDEGELTLDARTADVFKYAGASSETLAGIEHGIPEQMITIYGQATNTITVDNVADNISVASSAVLSSAAHFIKLLYVEGIWIEVGRGS